MTRPPARARVGCWAVTGVTHASARTSTLLMSSAFVLGLRPPGRASATASARSRRHDARIGLQLRDCDRQERSGFGDRLRARDPLVGSNAKAVVIPLPPALNKEIHSPLVLQHGEWRRVSGVAGITTAL